MEQWQQELTKQLPTFIESLKVFRDEVGEYDDLKERLVRMKDETVTAELNLASLKKEFAELDRRRAHEVGKAQAEYSRLVAANNEKQKELNRTNADLDQRKAELKGVMGQIDAIRQRLVGA